MGCGCKNAEGICGCSKRAETDMVEVPIKVVAVKDGDWNEYEGKMSIWDDGSLDEYDLEEQIRSSIEEGDYEILDVGDEDWDELDVTWVGHPVWESLKHSYEAEEPAVQEPDWIPQGDGRAIGQQDFAINLSPLHADTVGTPSPTFNEDITGQDGPSENPTNAVFEGTKGVSYQGRYGAQKTDMDSARAVLKRLGYIKNNDDILRDVFLYNDTPSKKTGRKADKYHYFALIENDDGKYFAINVNGPSRSVRQVVNILGPTGDRTWKPNGGSADFTSTGNYRTAFDAWRKKGKEKTGRKGYRALLFGKDGNILDEDYGIFNAEESLAQIEGPTAEATTGGLHAPSSFAMTWEDGTGQSSASIPPNEIAWAENVKEADGEVMGMGLVGWASVAILGYFGFTMLKANKVFNAVSSRTENRKSGCGCGKSAETKTVRKDSEYSVSQINPVEVEGQNDVYGAEELHSPQTSANVSQPNWGPQATYRQNPRRNFKMW